MKYNLHTNYPAIEMWGEMAKSPLLWGEMDHPKSQKFNNFGRLINHRLPFTDTDKIIRDVPDVWSDSGIRPDFIIFRDPSVKPLQSVNLLVP